MHADDAGSYESGGRLEERPCCFLRGSGLECEPRGCRRVQRLQLVDCGGRRRQRSGFQPHCFVHGVFAMRADDACSYESGGRLKEHPCCFLPGSELGCEPRGWRRVLDSTEGRCSHQDLRDIPRHRCCRVGWSSGCQYGRGHEWVSGLERHWQRREVSHRSVH